LRYDIPHIAIQLILLLLQQLLIQEECKVQAHADRSRRRKERSKISQ